MFSRAFKLIGGAGLLALGYDLATKGGPPSDILAKESGNHNVSLYGGRIRGDPKDTAEFKYFTYDTLPAFTDKHRSLMAKLLTPEMFARLKDRKTGSGYTLSNAIQTGVETPHLGVGITAGDEESWETFKDIMYPVIRGWHNFDPNTQFHKTDLDASKLNFNSEQQDKFDQYVVSTRIRAARNVSGFPLPAGTDVKGRAGVEKVLSDTFACFSGDLKGKYYSLGSLSAEDESFLRENGFLFQKPKTTNLLTNAGAARDWPNNRGIFHNDNRTALCWVNEEDHCRIISMQMGGNVQQVFARFASISDGLQAGSEKVGAKLMYSDRLGFLGTCPSNLGTGLRASVMIKLPELNKDPALLEKICDSFDLQPRGSAGEHSAAVGAKWDISNKQRIGFSEVELVQKMIDGVDKVIKAEEKLASGAALVEGVDY